MGSENRKKVCVIDGQGGGIGAAIIKKLKEKFEEKIEVIALGTNAIATAQMLKARANKGASGSNAIVHTVKKADVIIGPLGIIMPHAMMGEVTPLMAEAVCSADAKKILLPLTQENIEIVGVSGLPLPQLVDELLDKHLSFLL
jgi:NAD(P)-dependent dehydrogenase (short-subunit alcohol dehydrogenase family)